MRVKELQSLKIKKNVQLYNIMEFTICKNSQIRLIAKLDSTIF